MAHVILMNSVRQIGSPDQLCKRECPVYFGVLSPLKSGRAQASSRRVGG